MRPTLRLIWIIITTAILFPPTISASAGDELFPPTEYIQTKLQQNDIIFLGTTHKKPEILGFITGMIPRLKGIGVTHVGVEITSDQQDKIDHFMEIGGGLNDVQFHTQVDHPDYRNLFYVLRKSGGPVPIAIDLPHQNLIRTFRVMNGWLDLF